MPLPIRHLTPRGVTNVAYSVDTLAQAALHEPDGVYTLGRTYYRDQVLLFNEHLDRLEDSAQREGIMLNPDHGLNRAAIRHTLRAMIHDSGYDDVRWRITIPRANPDEAFLTVAPFEAVPPEIIQHGCRVILTDSARQNPLAKTTGWMKARAATVDSFPPGIYEGLLTNAAGELLECTSSNFYAVVAVVSDSITDSAGDHLYTADAGVLGGIAQRVVLHVAPQIISVTLCPATRADLDSGRISEAFLSSAGRGVVPIVEIAGITLGSGQPGVITTAIRIAYDHYVAENVTPL